MNKELITSLSAALVATSSAFGQGTFQDLDFESARLVFVTSPYYTEIVATNALPGWSAFSGANPLSTIFYNDPRFFPPVELLGSNSLAIGGNFSVLLSEGGGIGTNIYGPGSISQTGLVPTDAQTLLFEANLNLFSSPGSSLVVSLGGQNLSYMAIFNAPNYTLYGADISMFAGQTEILSFMAAAGLVLLDNIQFSPQVIPEPSIHALLGLGGLFLAALSFWRFCQSK
jgi:hypothetical protein